MKYLQSYKIFENYNDDQRSLIMKMIDPKIIQLLEDLMLTYEAADCRYEILVYYETKSYGSVIIYDKDGYRSELNYVLSSLMSNRYESGEYHNDVEYALSVYPTKGKNIDWKITRPIVNDIWDRIEDHIVLNKNKNTINKQVYNIFSKQLPFQPYGSTLKFKINGDDSILELNRVTSNVSGSGRTKEIDMIWDLPTSDKSYSSSVLLKDKLRKQEFDDMVKLANSGDMKDSLFTKFNFQSSNPRQLKLQIAVNNINFLENKEGELRCEYCNSGPLKIYQFNDVFNKRDGATADHKKPISKGGLVFNWKNLAVCCWSCNNKKDDMDYEEWMNRKVLLESLDYEGWNFQPITFDELNAETVKEKYVELFGVNPPTEPMVFIFSNFS